MASIQLVLNAINNTGKAFGAVIASATEAANRVDDLNSRIDVTSTALAGQAAAAGRATAALDDLAGAAVRAAAAQDGLAAKTAASGAAAGIANAGWGRLFGTVSLFGGAATIGGLHLAVDVLGEIASVVIPATIAFAAFGAAAVPTIHAIVEKEQALYTVSQALGVQMPGLTGGFQRIAAAVQPNVYVLFGEALNTINAHTGLFSALATGAGQVLDNLGARAELALGGSGLGGLIAKGDADLQLLGNIIGNVFGVLGNVLKTLPGYANTLFSGLQAVTGALETITGSPIGQGLLSVGLAMHGIFVWGGLAATGAVMLGNALAGLGAKLGLVDAAVFAFDAASFGTGLKLAASYAADAAVALFSLSGAQAVTAASTGVLEGALIALDAVNPLVWAGLAAAALGGFVYWLLNSKSAAQQLQDQIDKQVSSATTFTAANLDLAGGLQDVNAKLASTPKYLKIVHAGFRDQASTITTELNPSWTALVGTQAHFSGEQVTLNSRMSQLDKITGSAANTLADLNALGIDAGTIATDNAGAYAKVLTEIRALATANTQLAGYTGGQALAAQNALTNEFMNSTLPAIQKVTQAETALLSVITGSQSATDTFQLGMATLAQNLASAGGKAGTASHSLDGIRSSASLAGAAIGGTTQADYALNQAFYTQVGNAQGVISSLMQQSVSQKDLATVTATAARQMLTYAGNNAAARSVIVDMVNNALGPATVSYGSLNRWVGANATSLAGMNTIVAQATIQAGALTGALHGQAGAIASQLIGDINQAILKYDGVTKAAQAYGQAVAQDGRDSAAAHSARAQLISDLIASGKAAGDSKNQIAAMITKVLGIPSKRALQLVMTGTGSYSVSQVAVQGGGHRVAAGTPLYGTRGARIPGYGGGDIVAAMVEPGETIVPKHLTPAIAPLMKAHGVPGFTAGGLITGGNTSVLTGQYAVTSYDKFTKSLTDAVASALKQQLTVSSTAISGNVGSYTSVVQTALRMLSQPLTDVSIVLKQIQTESGGNATIVNRTDCLPLDCLVLTRRGWLKHDEVRVGDETIGYNVTTGRSEWTRIIRVVHYEDAPLIRMGNSRWQVTSTPNHRWLNMRRTAVPQPERDSCPLCPWPEKRPRKPTLTECPECGWLPKAPGGVPLHRSLKHGIKEKKRDRRTQRGRRTSLPLHLALAHGIKGTGSSEMQYEPSWLTTDKVTGSARILLSAPADTGTGLDITLAEAAILGWIAGDGHIERVCPSPSACREAGYLPSGICREHRARQNPTMSIGQSKPTMVAKLSALMSDVPCAHYAYASAPSRVNHTKCPDRHTWRLDYRYARDLMNRAGNPKTDAVAQVLGMSARQREAWLEAVIDAEGHREPGRSAVSSEQVVISQTYGPVLDAIALAVYLSGYRPRIRDNKVTNPNWSPSATVSPNSPYITGSYLRKQDAGRGPVWCVTTELGSWTAESGGHMFLTGNSNWAAGTPSVGALQVIGPTFAAYAGPFRNTGPFEYGVSVNPLANVYAGLNYALHRYGPNWTSVLGQGHGYASGGIIPEPVAGIGLRSGSPYSFGENGPETVTPGTGRGLTVNFPNMIVRDEADIALINQKLSAAVRTASLGGGVR